MRYTVPTILMLIMMLLYYLARPKLRLHINRTFLILLIVETMTAIMDMVSTDMDMNYASYHQGLLFFANALFFIGFTMRSMLFFQFTAGAVHLRFSKDIKKVLFFGLPEILTLLLVLTSYWTHWVFYIDGTGYYAGHLYRVIYYNLFVYLWISFVLFLKYRKNTRPMKQVSLLLMNTVLLTGGIARILFPHLLLMNFFCMLATFAVFITFQNPELYIETRTGLFDKRAFDMVFDERFHIGAKDSLLFLVIRNYDENKEIYGISQLDQGLREIANFLKAEFAEADCYYLRNGVFVLAFKGEDNGRGDLAISSLRQRFTSVWSAKNTKLYLKIGFIKAKSQTGFESPAKFQECLNSLLNEMAYQDANEIIEMNDNALRKYEHHSQVKRILENAIEKNEVCVFFQPVADAKTFKIVGAEALARLYDPTRGYISPAEFIPIAEKNGTIAELGKQIFEKTCAYLSANRDTLSLQWVNVNLSPIQCMNDHLAEEFREIIDRYEVKAENIHLEITEQSVIDSFLLDKQICRMRKNGFRFVLDDYGSGYSNVMRVEKLSLINVKLDMDFVRAYFEHPDILLPTSIDMFKKMNYSVTAEGVETLEMAEALRDMGCTYLQGYYFSKPVPFDEFLYICTKNKDKKKSVSAEM